MRSKNEYFLNIYFNIRKINWVLKYTFKLMFKNYNEYRGFVALELLKYFCNSSDLIVGICIFISASKYNLMQYYMSDSVWKAMNTEIIFWYCYKNSF